MEEDTTQQDADSGDVKCPKCGFSFTPTVDEAGEEKKVLHEQVDPEILKELRDVMSTSYKYPVDDEGLKKCIMKTSINLKKLLNFFKDVAALHENTDQGEGDQMEEDTTQQDADSGSVESPECGSSGPPAVEQAGEEETEEKEEQEVQSAGQKPSWWSSWSWSKGRISTHSAQPLRIPPVYTVKVHSVSTGQTCGADDEILEKVKNMKWTQVKITGCQECDIIIVFCPITSRVGSDVSAAMREIPAGDKPVILVLMHHTRRVHFLTDVKKWSGIYQNVKLDVHVLFHETQPGLLKCPRNDEAVHQIQTVLKDLSRSWF
ncbi:uncharacterized protein LOC119025278 isoform X3 [Acanthopagrus latus]|uniref:uncharacterized protein LOC119025278 isoform X3 n=1 Tax=Acanthopagrus latus TaxID=8177 RepID=UPI00187CD9C2|nr:uncharacterized protein LOC119025278 isoform X3 [Acanthopagrus latus]